MTKSRFTPTKRALIFWTLFIGLGAVFGSYQMLTDPTGKSLQMDAILPYFQKMPFADVLFRDYIFSGIALLLVNGLPNLLAAGLMIVGKKLGVLLGGIFGVTLMLWICIQFWLFPANPLSISYFVFGFLQAITGMMAWIFAKQEAFHVCQADYPRIGTNHKRLVVFFSRMGYTRKKALEEADRTGADIYEVKATERTEGTLGFWWCGRYGMHRWAMPIEPIRPCDPLQSHLGFPAQRAHAELLPCGFRQDPGGRLYSGAPPERTILVCCGRNGYASGPYGEPCCQHLLSGRGLPE